MIETETGSMSGALADGKLSRRLDINPTLIDGDLEDWASEINSEHVAALDCAETAVEHARRAGGLLIKAKQALSHGDWLPWVAANIQIGERHVQNYMKLARANTQRVSDLSQRRALAELAAPVPKVTLLSTGKSKSETSGCTNSASIKEDIDAGNPASTDNAINELGGANAGNPALVDSDLSVTNVTDDEQETPGEGHRASDVVTNVTPALVGAVDTLAATDANDSTKEPTPKHEPYWNEDYVSSLESLLIGDDKLVAAHVEIKRQAAEISILKGSRDSYLNQSGEITKWLKKERSKSARLERQIERLKAENETLRGRVASMEESHT